MNFCVIRQPAGLGDILFCQKLATDVIKKFNIDVLYWPVSKQYEYIEEYIKNVDCRVKFVKETDDFPIKQCYNSVDPSPLEVADGDNTIFYFPLDFSYKFFDTISVLESKYVFIELDYENWPQSFNLIRNAERENFLVNKLGLDLNEKYNIININYGTYPNYAKYNRPLVIGNTYKNITMEFLGFDRIFDWIPVLENAQEIHTVNTSIVYIIEKLNIKGKLFMYNRNDKDFSHWYSKKMYRNDWNYVAYD